MKISAQALTRNPISDSGGRRMCRQIQKDLKNAKINDLGTANGLQMLWFTWVGPMIVLRDAETQTVVGYMELSHVSPTWGLKIKYYQSGVFVEPAYRGRRLGTVLYLGALHVFSHLVSDPIIGIDAVRTWRSLEKHGYKVRMWDAKAHKGLNFTWASDGQPLIEGKPMDAYKSDLLFYT